jgi:uncharacterized protein (UPF0548 family)
MISVTKPSGEQLRQFLAVQGKLDFSYQPVSATASFPPAGYAVDHTRALLGKGESVFQAAKAALQGWEQFRLGWLEAWSPEPTIQKGNDVVVLARILGCWWWNACRVVYVLTEEAPVTKFGFAYGTLPDHVARGEERFMIEWDRRDDTVWYDILAFSCPQHILARLVYPYMRRVQKRFGPASAAVIQQAALRG